MDSKWKVRILVVVLLICARSAGAADQPIAAGFNKIRIENELRLKIPVEMADEVYRYLSERYDPKGNDLTRENPLLATSLSDEAFTDRYYDTPEFVVYQSEGGIRHRTRIVTSDPTNAKSGRQLVQLKIKRESENINRSEVKYKVDPIFEYRTATAATSLLSIVHPTQRGEFARFLDEGHIDARRLLYVMSIRQRRRRVYFSFRKQPFASITVDEATASRWWGKVRFAEAEVEPTEIGYTSATPAERIKLEIFSRGIRDDLMDRFPQAKADQTPKYTKAFVPLSQKFWFWPLALRLRMPIEVIAAGAAIFIVGAVLLAKRYR